jgi:hypothetical protein
MHRKEQQARYEALLQRALVEYDAFSLLWSKPHGHSGKNAELEEWARLLEPHLLDEQRARSHRGATLKGGKAVIRTYAVRPESIEVLKREESVFGFTGLWAPEALTFYKNGKIMYWSSAHEEREWYAGA